MPDVSIEIRGAKELANFLQQAPAEVALKAGKKGVSRSAPRLRTLMRRSAPKLTGFLKSMIVSKVGRTAPWAFVRVKGQKKRRVPDNGNRSWPTPAHGQAAQGFSADGETLVGEYARHAWKVHRTTHRRCHALRDGPRSRAPDRKDPCANHIQAGALMPYVYAHFRASDRTCFYVGKGTGNRIKKKDNRNIRWHRTVNKHGMIAVKLKDFDTDAEAYAFEAKAIEAYRASGHKLVNLTEGGHGPKGFHFTEEVRAKMRAAAKNKPSVPCSPEKAAKIGAANSVRKRTPEELEMLRRMAQNQSPETRAKIAAAGRGRKHSEETKAKISASNMGKVIPREVVEKVRASLTGKKNPKQAALWANPEYRTRMSEIFKAAHAAKRAMKEAANG